MITTIVVRDIRNPLNMKSTKYILNTFVAINIESSDVAMDMSIVVTSMEVTTTVDNIT